MLDSIGDLLADEGFRTGLVFGLAAAGLVGVAALVARPVRPWAGAAFGVAAALALLDRFGDADRIPVGRELVVGLVVLAAGGVLARGGHLTVRMAAAVPGAVLVARSTELHDPAWARPTIVVATVVGGALVAESDRALGRRGLTPVLLAVTVLGVYVTTPDTEHARVLAGVALAVALLGWPWPLASLGTAGSLVTTALVSWTVVVDGLARPGAVVGGLACLGVFVIEPVLRRPATAHPALRPPQAEPALPRRRLAGAPLADLLVAGGVHLALVAACSRVAGLRTSAIQALAISAAAYVLAAAALVVAERRRRVHFRTWGKACSRPPSHRPVPRRRVRRRP